MIVTHIPHIIKESKSLLSESLLWELAVIQTHTHILYITSGKKLIVVHIFPTKFIGFPCSCHPSCQGSQANCISQAPFSQRLNWKFEGGSGFHWRELERMCAVIPCEISVDRQLVNSLLSVSAQQVSIV
ncbi:hypothetical protein XENOCAPTIV_012880 [Xenoophorus captivus]|uniref:Uncharacterized protein n=1 Tax=Xenoophorus captivus TaxID=1517983 RepID=A0ABV0RSL6_9TELE